MDRNGAACGSIEDTRRAKRLILADGTELVSAHLSDFAYRDVGRGAAFVREALIQARRMGYPALFVAASATDSHTLFSELGENRATLAPATIYGHGFAPGTEWNLNTAEI